MAGRTTRYCRANSREYVYAVTAAKVASCSLTAGPKACKRVARSAEVARRWPGAAQPVKTSSKNQSAARNTLRLLFGFALARQVSPVGALVGLDILEPAFRIADGV